MSKHMIIRLGEHGDFALKFQIHNTPMAQLWVDRMHHRLSWPLDHPGRFYGFGTLAQEHERAVDHIQRCISIINSHIPIIHRSFEFTQDCFNYLHSIFEQYHGLLDQQDSDYWKHAPVVVKQALAELNLAVHRCESVATGSRPRFVCTWFGMPKTHCLNDKLQQEHGTLQIKFGTVYLNYCEIGKTLEDLAHDNDKYISDDAFYPFSHYSADFKVLFYDRDLTEKQDQIQTYIEQHQDFFLAHNITSVYNTKAQPLRFPVADLLYTGNQEQLLSQIARRQWVHEVTLE